MLKRNQNGFAHLLTILVIVIAGVVGFTGWKVYGNNKKTPTTSNSTSQTTTAAPKINQPDSADTLTSPSKVTTSDGKQYFYYGAPAGQNNASPKRIIISLPGHGTSAEDDYAAWQPHITGGKYALASLNWWDGSGETKTDYYSPVEIVTLSKAFLKQEGYTSSNLIILEGFSRGSANTYSVIANDRISKDPIFDAAISASGKYQSDFSLFENSSMAISTSLFSGVYWVLACGGKDDDPNRDGCLGMSETKIFLEAHGASVLGLLEDPNGAHGAFHKGSLGLPKQALDLISAEVIGS